MRGDVTIFFRVDLCVMFRGIRTPTIVFIFRSFKSSLGMFLSLSLIFFLLGGLLHTAKFCLIFKQFPHFGVLWFNIDLLVPVSKSGLLIRILYSVHRVENSIFEKSISFESELSFVVRLLQAFTLYSIFCIPNDYTNASNKQ